MVVVAEMIATDGFLESKPKQAELQPVLVKKCRQSVNKKANKKTASFETTFLFFGFHNIPYNVSTSKTSTITGF